MRNIGFKIVTAILLISSGVFAFMYFTTDSKLENELSKGLDQKVKDLKREAELKDNQMVTIITNFNTRIQDLSDRADNIKYVPYEKLLYVDRDVNTAMDVISSYNYDSGTTGKKR